MIFVINLSENEIAFYKLEISFYIFFLNKLKYLITRNFFYFLFSFLKYCIFQG
jgi:hypothetical protein